MFNMPIAVEFSNLDNSRSFDIVVVVHILLQFIQSRFRLLKFVEMRNSAFIADGLSASNFDEKKMEWMKIINVL
jgi:hypothetical protein